MYINVNVLVTPFYLITIEHQIIEVVLYLKMLDALNLRDMTPVWIMQRSDK